MCNIGAIVSLWKASTADLMVWKEKEKTQATSNASNETPRFDAVKFLEAVLVSLTIEIIFYNIFFREITLIIIQTNKLTDTYLLFSKWKITKI